MNGLILDSHRARIEDTPFKWCLYMRKPLQICNPLLLEMLKRWLPAQESFRVMQRSIPFTCVDICKCLGLGVVGLDVDFDKNVYGVVGGLLKDRIIIVETVIEIIKSLVESDSDEVDNVCRLYIFFCFVVLYFPRNSKTISNIPCSILDDIDRLSNYNWGKAVYNYLVKSLSREFLALRQTELCLSGSATVLQVHSTSFNSYSLFVLCLKCRNIVCCLV